MVFLGSEALAAGAVTRHQLTHHHEMLHRDVYIARGAELTPSDKARAAWLWSRRRAVVAGLSAAALHGCKWIDAAEPAELNQRSQHKVAGIMLHCERLDSAEIGVVHGIPATTPARTAFDPGRRRGPVSAVLRLDALLQATTLTVTDVRALIGSHGGARGVVQLRHVLALADDGAESPQETRLRLVLTKAGMRPSRTQIEVYDEYRFIGRLDMGWPEWKVGVQYDGAQHWTDPPPARTGHRTGCAVPGTGVADHPGGCRSAAAPSTDDNPPRARRSGRRRGTPSVAQYEEDGEISGKSRHLVQTRAEKPSARTSARA